VWCVCVCVCVCVCGVVCVCVWCGVQVYCSVEISNIRIKLFPLYNQTVEILWKIKQPK